MDGIELAEVIYQEQPVLVILISARSVPELIERAEAEHVMG